MNVCGTRVTAELFERDRGNICQSSFSSISLYVIHIYLLHPMFSVLNDGIFLFYKFDLENTS